MWAYFMFHFQHWFVWRPLNHLKIHERTVPCKNKFSFQNNFWKNSSSTRCFMWNSNKFIITYFLVIISNFTIKGATKSYFTHHSCVVNILFIMDLYESAFSTYSLKKLVSRYSAFCVFCLYCFQSDSMWSWKTFYITLV